MSVVRVRDGEPKLQWPISFKEIGHFCVADINPTLYEILPDKTSTISTFIEHRVREFGFAPERPGRLPGTAKVAGPFQPAMWFRPVAWARQAFQSAEFFWM
jgi:hypothetical protein